MQSLQADQKQPRADELPAHLETDDGGATNAETAAGSEPSRDPLLENPYVGIASGAFPENVAAVLMESLPTDDIEIRPDGAVYLPEIKYRRILNRAFGPGAWSLVPMEIRVDHGAGMLYYRGVLYVYGRFVSEAIGEQQYTPEYDRMSYATAAESAKSSCLMRCCKDLGIASELWDPGFVQRWTENYALAVWCVNIGSNSERGKRKKMWRKRTAPPFDRYPWREDGIDSSQVSRPAGGGAGRSTGESARPVETGRSTGQRPLAAAPRQQQRSVGSPKRSERAETVLSRSMPEPSSAASPEPESVLRTTDTPEGQAYLQRNGGPGRVPGQPISYRQVRRFRAIAGAHGWNNRQIAELLSVSGYQQPEQIIRNDYERLCNALEQSPDVLERLRNDKQAA